MPRAEPGPRGRPAAGRRARPVVELAPAEYDALFRRNALWVLVGAVVFAAVYALLAWLLYRNYFTGRFDLGNMVQAVYNTAHGRVLETTTNEMDPRQMSRLGSHVDPILAVFALPWLVWPSPVMLLVLQAVVVAAGAYPAYRLGARVTRDPRAGALLAGAFLLYPALGYGVLNEFHPVTLATTFLLFGFLYLEERRWPWAAVALVLAALCKEEVPLVIALLGVYFAVRQRSLRPLLVTASALVWFVLVVWVVIPHYNQGQSAFVSRYAAYGDSAAGVAAGVVSDPARTVGDLTAAGNLRYWWQLLWPFGLTPLLSPLTLLVAAPELMLNALSSVRFQRSIAFHYTAAVIPFVYAAAALGLMRLWRWLAGGLGRPESELTTQLVRRESLAVLVLVAALAANFVLGPLPFSLPGARYEGSDYAKRAHAHVLDEAVATIPDGVAVSVTNNVGGHLSARRVVYTFPYYEGAAYVIVDQTRPFVFDREDVPAYDQALAALVLDGRYRSIYARDGVLVFRRVEAAGAE
jgi:uncharacterized membrane protein